MSRGVVTTEGDAARITFERLVAASPARVWEVLTEPHDLAAWLDAAARGEQVPNWDRRFEELPP